MSEFVTLHDAGHAKYLRKKIRMRCLVAGKDSAPFIVPRRVQSKVTMEDGSIVVAEYTFENDDPLLLSLIGVDTAKQTRQLVKILRLNKSTATITVLDSINVEEVYLIPAVDQHNEPGPYTIRRCYYVGHGLLTNQVYDFIAYTVPHPKTQNATHILTKATPAQTSIDAFKMTPALFKRLKETFQTDDIHAKVDDIASQMAEHVTHIYGRDDLHTAVDLVFHSVLEFVFDGVRVGKGWLEALILGDTRTGKGYVAEGLCRHFGVGELLSGENITLAGLVGGIQRANDRYILTWGKIPLSDRRLVIIDECSSLSYNDITRLSRIRSEGIAEVTKIISEKTTARTRLIWVGNPRPSADNVPRMLSSYNYGIDAVNELIGTSEDVARFDYVLIVAKGEVASKEINKKHTPSSKLRYDSDICNALVTWAWSRRAEHIVFDSDVSVWTLRASQDLGQRFTPRVCLIQAEDVRFKLLRIACAVAARTFSTDDGEHLRVTREHVVFAYTFLHHLYQKDACGYAQLSAIEHERNILRHPTALRKSLERYGDAVEDLIDGLLEHRTVAPCDIADYAGIDIFQARSLISELVRFRAIVKEHSYYVKRPPFKKFLQAMKNEMTPEQPVTMDIGE